MPPRSRKIAKPYGREEVTASLLDAARDLFAQRGPASVSVRDIAERAHVNHGLIYRHFGTKEALLKAVLRREAIAFSAATSTAADPAESARLLLAENIRREPFLRILAFSLLSDARLEDLHSEEGALRQLVARMRDSAPHNGTAPDVAADPRIAVAAVSAFMKGWLLFEPWVLQAVDATDVDPAAVREHVGQLLGQILGNAPDQRPTVRRRKASS